MRSDQRQFADVEWLSDGIPKSPQFDDPYFSKENGLEETRHVFLQGNDLPSRFRPGFHVAELGFGTGLNLLAVWKLWRDTKQVGKLCYTSFEAYPMSVCDMAKASVHFPELAELSTLLFEALTKSELDFDDLDLEVITGDANIELPLWQGQADAWFLDGFSPAKNPELWNSDILGAVASKTCHQGTFATYTAAGHVRRSLASAGFQVERIPGFGRKRHMTVGKLEEKL